MQSTLALSLHAPNHEIRKQLMQIENKYPMDDLHEALKYYVDKTGRRITIEYLLIKGLNDTISSAKQLATYLKDIKCNINDIIDREEINYQHLKADTRHQLDVWREFLDLCAKNNVDVPSFPIWAMEFGATYDYEDGNTPNCSSLSQLKASKGTLGNNIVGRTRKDCLSCIPPYSRADVDAFPAWKKKYIKQNRDFYTANRAWLDEWKEKIRDFAPSHQKMEWNCGNVPAVLDDKIIQFRASGIRVKLPTFSPALNLVGTQVPILPWIVLPEESRQEGETKGRYMTVHEASKLQGMQDLHFADDQFRLTVSRCYEALGNAVNVSIVQQIAERMITDE